MFLQQVRQTKKSILSDKLDAFPHLHSPIRIMYCSFQCNPPVQVHDLFTDIQDGRILMALLEELSGCKLVRKTSIQKKKEKKNAFNYHISLIYFTKIHELCNIFVSLQYPK